MAHLLLAESNPLARIKLEWMLKDLDFTVTVAENAEETFQALHSDHFDLAILGMDMQRCVESKPDSHMILNGDRWIPSLSVLSFFTSGTLPHASPPRDTLAPPDMLAAILSTLDQGPRA